MRKPTMTHSNKTRRTQSPRRGITLLFVISMIVLFLLMGTTFVVVSNNFFREANKRNDREINKIDGKEWIERGFALAVRGDSIDNPNSPFRGVDLLSDQYGYGLKTRVSQSNPPVFAPNSANQFVNLVLSWDPTTPPDGQAASVLDTNDPPALGNIPQDEHSLSGLVLSFTSGVAKGLSVRIVSHTVTGAAETIHTVTIPWSDGSITLADLQAALQGSEVIINGFDFTGDVASHGTPAELLFPNRQGETAAQFIANFLDNSPVMINEPWDAADGQNVFLAGYDRAGNFIPSFLREVQETFITSSGAASGASAQFYAFNDSLDVDSDFDGTNDALWIDAGFPVQTSSNGKLYRPLIAYRIEDLDGRLNLNAHGNSSQLATNNRFIGNFIPTPDAAPNVAAGAGYGPAEVELSTIFESSVFAEDTVFGNVLSERYAGVTNDGFPGLGNAVRSRRKLFGHPNNVVDWSNGNFGTVGRKFSTAMDIAGRFKIVTPSQSAVLPTNPFDRFLDLNEPNFRNALPGIDMITSSTTTIPEFNVSPYEMNFASAPYNTADDSPFTEHELERLLRRQDADTPLLPNRLWNVPDPSGSATPANYNTFWTTDTVPERFRMVTTRSFEVPVIYRSAVSKLREVVEARAGLTGQPLRNAVRTLIGPAHKLLAPELLAKLKMDINRPFGNGYDGPDADFVVDNPGEATSEANTDQFNQPMDLNNDGVVNNAGDANARIEFARQLYVLALLLTNADVDGDGTVAPAEELEFNRHMAQWAINVVDFRDADSIMTRFDYDPNPWDGWNPTEVVWGCERPEMLLTETMAGHARRTEDLSGSGDYDQRLRPEAFTYFELTNPWTQNSLNQVQDPSLYDPSTQGIDLARINSGASAAWRLVVERPDRTNGNGNQIAGRPLRYVYFVDPDSGAAVGDDDAADVEVYFPSAAVGTLIPGQQAVVGTLGYEDPSNAGEFRTFLGRLNTKVAADEAAGTLDLDLTHHIRINPSAGEVSGFPADPLHDPRLATIVPIDQARPGSGGTATDRQFSVSDPFGGYPDIDSNGDPIVDIPDGDGAVYTSPYTTPLDSLTDSNRDASDIQFIQIADGMAQDFRTVRLQRLANPLLPWDANLNPYLTIDSMEIDLISFNGVTDNTGGANPETFSPAPTNNEAAPAFTLQNQAMSLVRGEDESTDNNERRVLFGFQRVSLGSARTTVAGANSHYFNVSFATQPAAGANRSAQTLGKTNDEYRFNGGNHSFAWLTWNNRPFANQVELMNVPYVSPDRLTYTPFGQERTSFYLDDDTISDPYLDAIPNRTLSGRYPHLLNFYSQNFNFFRLLEYTEVPSRFVGTETPLAPTQALQNPFNFVSRYRSPGKINLNTIPSDAGAAGSSRVWDALLNDYVNASAPVSWNQVRDSIYGNAAPGAGQSTNFENPFRPSEAHTSLLQGSGGVDYSTLEAAAEISHLLRKHDNTDEPLFDYETQDDELTTNANRNVYFRNGFRQRLANMTTTRSSVFAMWITVGYFEVDPDGTLKVDAGEGVELGADTGEAVRHRGFYIFDRSIPMAFEPGKDHNIDRGILVKSIIE